MKIICGFCLLLFTLIGCDNDNHMENPAECDIQKVYTDNAKKLTIANGIWGTVSSMEGNCMPVIQPGSTTCKHCPVKRMVKIYEYTLLGNATPSGNSPIFFDSFKTRLIKQLDTDDNGFFQTSIPPGQYTIVVVENGKLYANGSDGQGGLSPVTFTNGTQKIDLTMTYKAVF